MKHKRRLVRALKGARNLGTRGTLTYSISLLRGPFSRQASLGSAHPQFSLAPLYFRRRSSDPRVFNQIFLDREYRCLDRIPTDQIDWIIDCGANVGYATAYLLSRFTKAHAIAIEPDTENLQLLHRNLQSFNGRYTAICAGVWSESGGLVFESATEGLGNEWARQVRPAKPYETPTIDAISITEVIRQIPSGARILMKVDIEGSEIEVFSKKPTWINDLHAIVIELHGDVARNTFREATEGCGFSFSTCDELTVCTRQRV